MFGPPVPVTPDDVGQIVVGVDTRDSAGRPSGKVVPLGDDEFRRSIYVQVRRSHAAGHARTVRRAGHDAQLRAARLVDRRPAVAVADEQRVRRRAGRGVGRAQSSARPAPIRAAQFRRAWRLAFAASAVGRRSRDAAWRSSPQQTAAASEQRSPAIPKQAAGPTPAAGRAGASLPGAAELERIPVRRLRMTRMSHFTSPPLSGTAGLWAWAASRWPGCSTRTARWPRRPSRLLERPTFDLKPRLAAAAPQATAMISMFMQGGPSHIDLFDPKPELTKRHLQTFPGDIKYDNAAEASAKLFGSPWKFAKHGQCGMELSELLPHLGRGRRRHLPDPLDAHRRQQPRPVDQRAATPAASAPAGRRSAPGSPTPWARESQNLPAFVALTDPGGLPVLGVDNWPNGWLPSLYQGTVVRPQEPRILNLDPPPHLRGAGAGALSRRTSNSSTASISTGIRASTTWPRASPATSWPPGCRRPPRRRSTFPARAPATHKLYGLDDPATRDYGTRCLIARRLVERGVRFVQIFTGNQTWDHHGSIAKALPAVCRKTDKPAAALVHDLKQTRPARHHARPLGRRDGPPAGHPERKEHRPRPQHLRLQHVAGRRRHSRAATSTARPTSSATRPSRTS